LASDRPNQRTRDILGDPEIRDRAEDAARELQGAARERDEERTPAVKSAGKKRGVAPR
jgi:hypothetical protein